MSPMSDQPLTLAVLAEFHRDIILPDVQRIVAEAIAGSERRMQANFDAIFHKLHKLETEYESLKAGLKRVEERVGQMDQRLEQMVQRFDRVETRLETLEHQYQELLAASHRLEERLTRLEKQLDAVVAAQEKEPLRAEVADLRTRVDSLQAQVRSLEKRFDQ